jgi:hypothetical protein
MIRYHFDLYPRDDPRDGARVVRFTKLQAAEYRGEANGTGAGRLSIRADVAEAQLIDPRGLQYVRVVREDTVAVTEAVVGGFWLEQGDFSLLDEQGTRLLSFGGAGTLAYLSRAQMASHTYISPIFTGQDPFDDQWRLYAQSTVYANGNHLGAMLWRVLYEATHNVPGTHKHGDTPPGSTVSDTHDDDRPAIAIPDMVFDFDQFVDSSGNDWTQSSGEMKAQVGENVLAVVKRLMEAGLYVEMDPDTFEVRAWENEEHRRTRTGTAWGASVIYFTRPTGEDIDTGNIKSDAKRAIHAYIKRSWVLAGGNDIYGDATGTTDIPWEGFYYADVNDEAAAAGIAAVQIAARDDAGDTLRLRGRLGTDTSNGYYRPFEDALLDDLVTVHTGTDQFDLDDQDFPVAAITVNLRPGGDWDVWYDLGSAYTTTSSRQFQVQPVPAHNHTLPFCEPGTPGSVVITRLYYSDSAGAVSPITVSGEWESSTGSGSVDSLKTAPDGTYPASASATTSGGGNVGGLDVHIRSHLYGPLSAAEAAEIAAGGSSWRTQVRARMRFGVGVSDDEQSGYLQQGVRVTAGATTTIRGTALALHASNAGGEITGQSTKHNRELVDTLSAVATCVAGDYLLVETGIRNYTPDDETSGGALAFTSDPSLGDLPEGNDNTGAALNSWIEWTSTGGGASTGDLPHDTVHQGSESVGTASRISRCDHEHAHGLLSDDGLHYHQASHIDGLATDPPVIEGFVTTTLGGQHGLSTVASSGTTETIDLNDGNVHDVLLTNDCTFTFTGGTSGVECRFRLLIHQDDAGSRVPTFPASVVWPGETEPTWSTDPGAVDIIEFTTVDGGTTWYGDAGGSGAGGGASDLDDLTDVTITAPAEKDTLRHNGAGQFINDNTRWEPVTFNFGSGPELVWDGDDLVMEWKAY